MLSRRVILVTPAALVAANVASAITGKMMLSIHQVTSRDAGFRKSLEGWARAGIKYVELSGDRLDGFLKTETIKSARTLLTDLGLTPVSCGAGISQIWQDNSNRIAALDYLKIRCEQFSALGIDRIVCPGGGTKPSGPEEYKRCVGNIREVGEVVKQYRMTAMLEFTRASPFVSTLPTALRLTREAAHPNVRPMLDVFHFWAAGSKFEDLDMLRPGEIAHVHFEDLPDLPRELLEDPSRVIPGDGVAPLTRILRKLAEKGYSGALSVELFSPLVQQSDPYEVARRIREKAEAVMRQARVL